MNDREQNTEQVVQTLFSSDSPIRSVKQDRLCRSKFVERVAEAIKAWRNKESLVLAIYGEWGSGKSSAKNMLMEYLEQSADPKPHIVEFNPWNWAGQKQIATAFFREIGNVFGKDDKEKKDKKRSVKWKAYAEYLRTGSFFLVSLRKFILFVLALLAVTNLGSPFLKSTFFDSVYIMIGLIAVIVLLLVNWGAKVGERFSSLFGATARASRQSLEDLRKELESLLKQLKDPILIVVDDIDRLSAEEIGILFQLIKANCSFPNLIYLLLFQRDIVEKSLEAHAPKLNGNSGKEFLEKIIQVGFDLPLAERHRLYQVLTEELEKLVLDEAVLPRFDRQRWLNIFTGGINAFFENLRDVRRYLASLSFQISLFKNQGSFEVNPIDLIALEALRVFEPEVYRRLPASKSNLLEDQRRNILDNQENEKVQRIQESLLGNVSTKHKDSVKQILKLLFPNVGWLLDGYLGSFSQGMHEDWLRDLRVCNSTIFERYFSLAVPEGDITQAQLDTFLSVIDDRDALLEQFRILHEKGLAGPLLDRLEVYKQKIELKYSDSFIPALLDVADDLPDKLERLEHITSFNQISRIIYWYLQQEKDASQRAIILKAAIEVSNGILLPARIVDDEIEHQNQGENSERYGWKDKDLDKLKSFCLAKIRRAAENGRLINLPSLPYVSHCWSEWGEQKEIKEWFDNNTESSNSLLKLLSAFVQHPTSVLSGEAGMRKYWVLDIDSLEKSGALHSIQKRVSQLDTQSLSSEDQRIVRAFEIAQKRKAEGKKRDYGFDDEDEYEII